MTVAKNLITRVQRLVIEASDKETEINLFTSTLVMNNYLRDFTKRIIKKEKQNDKKRHQQKE